MCDYVLMLVDAYYAQKLCGHNVRLPTPVPQNICIYGPGSSVVIVVLIHTLKPPNTPHSFSITNYKSPPHGDGGHSVAKVMKSTKVQTLGAPMHLHNAYCP